MIAPSVTLFTVFIIIPTLWTIYVSFFDWQLRGASEFIGLTNYTRLWSDRIFLLAFRHTLALTVSITALTMVLGCIAAFLVNDLTGSAKYFARSSIFMPTIASLIVTAFIWRSFLEPDGLVQRSLAGVGIETQPWLSDPTLSFASVIIMSAWQRIGYNMVFFLAGLQTIPDVFYEAAEVDGASGWARFRYVTAPLMQRTTLFILVINTISAFLMFEQVFAMTGGGPMHATLTLMIHIYNQAFRRIRYGYAAAMAVVFSVVAFSISLIQMYLLRHGPEY